MTFFRGILDLDLTWRYKTMRMDTVEIFGVLMEAMWSRERLDRVAGGLSRLLQALLSLRLQD